MNFFNFQDFLSVNSRKVKLLTIPPFVLARASKIYKVKNFHIGPKISIYARPSFNFGQVMTTFS